MIDLNAYLGLIPHLERAPKGVWISYDADADVLYVSLGEPSTADDTEMDEQGVLTRYANGKVVGYTILNASKIEAR
jgi:uncharacterized protein YuzE